MQRRRDQEREGEEGGGGEVGEQALRVEVIFWRRGCDSSQHILLHLLLVNR